MSEQTSVTVERVIDLPVDSVFDVSELFRYGIKRAMLLEFGLLVIRMKNTLSTNVRARCDPVRQH